MPNLYFIDENGDTQTIANIDSPSFINEPCTVSINNHADNDVMNVEDTLNYINTKVGEFNSTRLVYSASNTLSNLVKDKKYMVSVYGIFNTGSNDNYNIGPIAVTDSAGNLLKSSGTQIKNVISPKCIIPQSATVIIDSVPNDGVLKGLINYDFNSSTGTSASYMVALRLS